MEWAPPHHHHFPFTLPEAPGEYSPSCQYNVAHRGNHAASLASGLPAPSTKCNFSTSSSYPRLPRYSMGRFSTQYETSSLIVGMRLCRSRGWGGFPSSITPRRSGNMRRCLYVSSVHVEKELSWVQRYPPTPAATFGFMSPVPSLRGHQRRSGVIGKAVNARAERRPGSRTC